MKALKRCLTAILLATALSQTGCPGVGRQPDADETRQNYERYNRFDTLYQKPAYMPNKR